MATGWMQIGSDWYFFNNSGSMAHDTWKGDYYLASSGKMATVRWHRFFPAPPTVAGIRYRQNEVL